MKYREAKDAHDASKQFVYMNDDGTTRDLTPEEAAYLATEFHPADGGRPYIKPAWRSRTRDGRRHGFARRRPWRQVAWMSVAILLAALAGMVIRMAVG